MPPGLGDVGDRVSPRVTNILGAYFQLPLDVKVFGPFFFMLAFGPMCVLVVSYIHVEEVKELI